MTGARLLTSTGRTLTLPLHRWSGPATPGERRLLTRACPPVLEVGAGPGRFTRALLDDGIAALAIDSSTLAARLARARGVPLVQRSVFDPLPDEGRWRTVLLVDGTIGIGGNVTRLLARTRELVTAPGHVLVETEAPGAGTVTDRARVVAGGQQGPWFPWTWLDADDLPRLAADAGFRVHDRWTEEDRWFAELQTR